MATRVISVYLQSGSDLTTEPNATIMAHLLAFVRTIPNWVAAGDWNVDLDKFASTSIAAEAKGQLLGTKEAALASGNTLDFALASRTVAGLLRLRVDKVVPFAPHFCLTLEVDVGHGLLNLPSLKGFSGIQHLLKPVLQSPTSASATATRTQEIGASPLHALMPETDANQGILPPQRPPETQALDIGGALLAPTTATRSFAAFSQSVEQELLGKAYGRGAHNPVVHKPLLRDDRQASRWHERPTAPQLCLHRSRRWPSSSRCISLLRWSCLSLPFNTCRRKSLLKPQPLRGPRNSGFSVMLPPPPGQSSRRRRLRAFWMASSKRSVFKADLRSVTEARTATWRGSVAAVWVA